MLTIKIINTSSSLALQPKWASAFQKNLFPLIPVSGYYPPNLNSYMTGKEEDILFLVTILTCFFKPTIHCFRGRLHVTSDVHIASDWRGNELIRDFNQRVNCNTRTPHVGQVDCNRMAVRTERYLLLTDSVRNQYRTNMTSCLNYRKTDQPTVSTVIQIYVQDLLRKVCKCYSLDNLLCSFKSAAFTSTYSILNESFCNKVDRLCN